MAHCSVKLLTTGSVAGSFQEFFDKLKSIDAKHGKFDFVLCVGDFFGTGKDDEIRQLLGGELEPPIECYLMQGEIPLPEIVVQRFAKTGGELCKKLFLLSKSGMVTTANGLRIACLGGTYDSSIYSSVDAPLGFLSPHFSTHTVERLLANTMSNEASQSYKTLSSIQSSAAASQLVDILITHSWPQSITQFTAIPPPLPDLASICAPPLDDVIRRIQPRYHFASGGGNPPHFWEREPFMWEEQGRVSRFISLGAFGTVGANAKKPRWFYAFTIQAGASTGVKPANATKNPFLDSRLPAKRPIESVEGNQYIFGDVQMPKRQRSAPSSARIPIGTKCRRCESTDHIAFNCPNRPVPHEGYVCRTCNEQGHFVRDCPTRDGVGDTGGRKPREGYMCRACGSDQHYVEDCLIPNEKSRHAPRRDRRPHKEIEPDECWFCLSNPNLAKYLIVAIGNECYLTLPKGQISPTQNSQQTIVPGGGHVLIVPIAHFPTYSLIPPDLALPITEETQRYKSALHAFYGKYGAVMVTFEVGRLSAKGGHAHVQAVPVPRHLEGKIEEAFVSEGRSLGIDFEPDPHSALESCENGRGSYFRVDLPDGRKLVHLIKDHVPFSVQFGRHVLVNLMGMPERLDWKMCTLSEQEDQANAQTFKAAFALFNPIE